jgi:hypothetical protein
MILSLVDGHQMPEEEVFVRDFLNGIVDDELAGTFIETEKERLQLLDSQTLEAEFEVSMNHFFSSTSPAERTLFLDKAMKLIKSDDQITREENKFIDKLFEAWDIY